MAKTGIGPAFFEKIREAFSEQALQKGRLARRAWKNFEQVCLTAKEEDFRFFPHSFLERQTFLWPEKKELQNSFLTPFILPGFEKSYAVFVDGRFSQEHSCLEDLKEDVVALSSKEAEKQYGIFLENQSKQKEQREKDPFVFLHDALSEEGFFLYLPEGKEKKIQILCFVTGPYFIFPKIQIVLSPKAKLTCYLSHQGEKDTNFWENSLCEIFLQKEAELILKREFQKSSGVSFHALRAFLEEGAFLDSFQFSEGQKTQKSSYRIELKGSLSKTLLKGFNLIEEKENTHTRVEILHKEPQAFSSQDFKAALKKGGEHHFEGLIYVEPKAQKTESYQLFKALLLGDAKAFARPKLEIFADDVKASHGATLSKIQEEDLFYLQTRGLSKEEAISLLTYAFFKQMQEDFGLKGSFFSSKLTSFMEE